ncbi:MAG: MarR family transcriptional regulator [Candidatus Andeanibacterium colombiense]|uniref:MarR family transcriptional regulator n=1 Tax=Candidatus Andeanibacterium colombiense TaxID=3121345 RepID=A0AAJ6BQ07_9SPHN|nr:MAG: MarR family transcriptional regulator [Sphingomonadaceae bacterium]
MLVPHATLGTLLRRLIEELDGAVDESYKRAGLDYRARFTPVVKALSLSGPLPLRVLAERATVSHSATSQTVSQMAKMGLVSTAPGTDGRERMVSLTPYALKILPELEACWKATEAAARTLDADLGQPVAEVLISLLDALKKRPFLDRILKSRTASEDLA